VTPTDTERIDFLSCYTSRLEIGAVDGHAVLTRISGEFHGDDVRAAIDKAIATVQPAPVWRPTEPAPDPETLSHTVAPCSLASAEILRHIQDMMRRVEEADAAEREIKRTAAALRLASETVNRIIQRSQGTQCSTSR